MPKPVTEKDVLYALEYLGSRLVMHAGVKASWTLEPGGLKVAPSIADIARAHGNIAPTNVRGEVSYAWKAAA